MSSFWTPLREKRSCVTKYNRIDQSIERLYLQLSGILLIMRICFIHNVHMFNLLSVCHLHSFGALLTSQDNRERSIFVCRLQFWCSISHNLKVMANDVFNLNQA